MNTRKMGKMFIVLMISLLAFGFGSGVNALTAGNNVTSGIIPSSINLTTPEQISVMEDSSFDPVRVIRHFYTNTTNSTNTTNVINNTINSTSTPTNSNSNSTKKN
ncbi:MAG TPA: hypothetical protein VK426_06870 [Methanobacterium sp.]|nr:hypothetical protein [Methanobacterium sp.]